MNQGFGNELPRQHSQTPHRKVTRFLVVIGAGGSLVARLCLEDREPVAEFDAGTEEVVVMTRGLRPAMGATGPEWDRSLGGHSAAERAAAEVYTLDV